MDVPTKEPNSRVPSSDSVFALGFIRFHGEARFVSDDFWGRRKETERLNSREEHLQLVARSVEPHLFRLRNNF